MTAYLKLLFEWSHRSTKRTNIFHRHMNGGRSISWYFIELAMANQGPGPLMEKIKVDSTKQSVNYYDWNKGRWKSSFNFSDKMRNIMGKKRIQVMEKVHSTASSALETFHPSIDNSNGKRIQKGFFFCVLEQTDSTLMNYCFIVSRMKFEKFVDAFATAVAEHQTCELTK